MTDQPEQQLNPIVDLARRVAELEAANAAQKEVNRIISERVNILASPPLDLGPLDLGSATEFDPAAQSKLNAELVKSTRLIAENLQRIIGRLDALERGFDTGE